MKNETETVTNILNEVRSKAHWMNHVCDRIEDAIKREISVALRRNDDTFAMAVKRADELKEALRVLVDACEDVGYKDGGTEACCDADHRMYDVMNFAKEVLSKSP